MQVTTVSTADGSLLRAVRGALVDADEAMLAVAFASEGGVNLLGRELRRLGPSARLLVTTVFGKTTAEALRMAARERAALRILNPGRRSTYHPKLYMGRRGGQARAVIGSANLTNGLYNNVELAVALEGRADEGPLAEAWAWAEARWADPAAVPWAPLDLTVTDGETPFDPELFAALKAEVARDPLFRTLGADPRPNRVVELNPTGLFIETERSAAKGLGPQRVPAWMFEQAWEALRAKGELSNATLLNELRVHRSSAVCAILARLPGVGLAPGRGITLRWQG